MKLYIRFGHLHKFNMLYKSSEYLQEVLEKETGITWSFDKDEKNEIEGILVRNKIKHEWDE